MAGDWIKMRCNLETDPAVIQMAAELDIDEFSVVGRLHHLWSWANQQSRDGNAPGVTASFVDRYVQRDGFATAMCSVGWMTISDDGVSLTNFDRHNGQTAKTRALTARRAVTHRSRSRNDAGVTREEKRREEKSVSKDTQGGVKFAPPSVTDVESYGRESGCSIAASAFVDLYESKGWMVGKNKMKNWKAAVRGWSKRQLKRGGNAKGNQRLEESASEIDRFLHSHGVRTVDGDSVRDEPHGGIQGGGDDGMVRLDGRVQALDHQPGADDGHSE